MENVFVHQKVHHLYKYINVDDNKYVFFSKLTGVSDDNLLLGVCDGYNTYTLSLTPENVHEHYKSTDFATDELFLASIKTNTESGNVSVSEDFLDVVVRFGASLDATALTLRSSTADERKELLKYIFFEVVEKLDKQEPPDNFRNEDVAVQLQVKEDSSARVAADGPVFLRLDEKRTYAKNNTQGKTKVKYGDSIVNPGTRKRKKATGVVFDDDT